MSDYQSLASTDYANFLDPSQVMDFAIKSIWPNPPRIIGPAFTVEVNTGDNLMLHAAIHQAPKGSVIVVDAKGDTKCAVAGGNVCTTAQRNGIAAFVIDGVIRDIGEIKEAQFPVFARGVVPIPGKKEFFAPLNQPISCGNVLVHPNDLIVADEDGVVVVPQAKINEVFELAKKRADKEANTSLDDWASAHYQKIKSILDSKS